LALHKNASYNRTLCATGIFAQKPPLKNIFRGRVKNEKPADVLAGDIVVGWWLSQLLLGGFWSRHINVLPLRCRRVTLGVLLRCYLTGF
jgi:hypothetical protein